MPLKLADPVKQVAILNHWSEDTERRLEALEAGLRSAATTSAYHKAVFAALYSNPQTLQKAMTAAGVSTSANTGHAGSSTVSVAGGSPVFTGSSPTTTSIQWTWPASTVYWPDGTQHTIPSSTSAFGGPYIITGLAMTTAYYAYPYWDYQTSKFTWVTGCNCTGTPCAAFTLANATAAVAAIQNANGHLPLSNGGITVTTGAAGTTSDTGGSRGGDPGCHPPYMLVQRKDGPVQISQVEVGECLLSREGWTTIKQKHVVPQEEFIRITLRDGSIYDTVPRHPVITLLGEKFAEEVGVIDWVFTKDGVGIVESVSRFSIPNGTKVILQCEPHHEFYIGLERPFVLAHNSRALS